jgi:PAS domain S-box-containing protein
MPIIAPLPSIRAARCAGLTLLVGLGTIALRESGFPLHNPTALLLFVVVFLAVRDGRAGGLASAAVAIASLTAFLFRFEYAAWNALDTEHIYFMVLAAPTMAWLVGGLRRRVSAAAQSAQLRQREAAAAAAVAEQYRTLAEALPEMVFTTNRDGWLDYYNQRWFDYTGLTLEQTHGWGWEVALHPDDLQAALLAWREAIAMGTPFEAEFRLRRASDGLFQWHLCRVVPVRDLRGTVAKWIGTCTNIDNQKNAAEKIRKWELVFRHSDWGALITEPDGAISLANPALERMHGYGPGELVGRQVFDLYPPEELEFLHEQRAVTERDGRVTFESSHKRKDGSRFPVLVSGMVVRGADHNIVFRVANYMDLSNVKAAEDAHARAEALFRAVQDASPDPFILWKITPDPLTGDIADATIAYANPAAYEMIGLDDASVRNLHIDDLFPGFRRSDQWPVYNDVYRTGLARELGMHQEENGEWHRRVVLKAGDHLGTYAWDVSAIKAAELIMRRSHDDLERIVAARTQDLDAARDIAVKANRAKSDFLSRASHELRTPLNSVIGFSNILLKNKLSSLNVAEVGYVERIKSNGTQLLGLVNDLLDLAKIEAGKITLELAPVSLFDLVHDVRQSLEPRALELGLLLTADLPREGTHLSDLTIIADDQRLRQVLTNLVGNAIKYTQSGTVTISVETNAAYAPTAIEVADTGPGIAEDTLEAIFEPFIVGTASAQGESAVGLGLAISRTLCDLMGYSLTVQSVIGVGTTFRISLTTLGDSSAKATLRLMHG